MGDDLPPNANGAYVRWTALAESERRLRDEWRSDMRDSTQRRDGQMLAMSGRIDGVEGRTDKLESLRDEQRGAWRLALWLIGGNLLATIVMALALLGPVR